MYISGSFINQKGDKVEVYILTKGDRTETVEIGTAEADVYFTDDPVEITNEVNDTFDVLLKQSATVHLLCGNLMTELFSQSCRDAVVNIYRGGKCVFAGYIEPQTYSQGYNDRWDELELNCVCALSSLQYSLYKEVGASGVDYTKVKASAAMRTYHEIISEILGGVTAGLDIVGGHTVSLWHDCSKALYADDAGRCAVFDHLTLSDLLFLGDEEDDTWQQDTVLEELLKYLNLHIVQDGFDFYIFAWETAKGADRIKWVTLDYNPSDEAAGTVKYENRQTTVITADNVASDDTTISIGEVYNQLQLTADVTETEDIIESPLDTSSLTSPFDNRQLYMTEYKSYGASWSAYLTFKKMIKETGTDSGGAQYTDWYVQIMQHKNWTFPDGRTADIVSQYSSEGKDQQALPVLMGTMKEACLMSVGSVTRTAGAVADNSPTSKISMTDYLVLSVNGNRVDNDEEKTVPSAAAILARSPIAIYTGNTAGGVFSPADDAVTNYIVISGSMVLNPIMDVTQPYTLLRNTEWVEGDYVAYLNNEEKSKVFGKYVPSQKGDLYYTRKMWKAESPKDTPTWAEGQDTGWYPFTDEALKEYQFNYSYIGEGSDKVSKVAVLACMLIVGDKCVVEKIPGDDKGTGITYTDDASLGYTNYTWQTYKKRSECASDDEYYQQSFTIGFDPNIGDSLIGQEHDIQTNFSYKLGIDTDSGMAIPIKHSDKVSGQVQFMILGVVNTVWDTVTRRHPTFFRHTKWSTSSASLMAHVSSVMVKKFEVKIYSDNGHVDNGNDGNDIVYTSDTDEQYVNLKDDLSMKINSALTLAECQTIGVSPGVNLSTPLDKQSGDAVLKIYDGNRNIWAKPEYIYVDSYWREWHKPRIVMEQKLNDDDTTVGLFLHYRHKALGKDFYVQGIGRNLMEGRADLTLKEIDNESEDEA